MQPGPMSASESLRRVIQLIQEAAKPPAPTGHDLRNALHAVLCAIEMLELDITPNQRIVFEGLELSAKHLEDQMLAYIRSQGQLKKSISSIVENSLDSK